MPERLQTTKVEGPNGEDIRVLFYDDGAVRFRVNGGEHWGITEFFKGNGQHAIVQIRPVPRQT
jgi:hypothetical protein